MFLYKDNDEFQVISFVGVAYFLEEKISGRLRKTSLSSPRVVDLSSGNARFQQMDTVLRAVVEAIHASPTQAVLCLSGGASQALGWLLSVPRASSTVLEVTVPYSRIAMLQFLGKVPAQYTSKETAEDIALAAYNRALRLAIPGVPVAGIGFTGALVSATPKRGEHRCYVAARTQKGLWEYNLTLSKGKRDRVGEDEVTSRILIKAGTSGVEGLTSLADVCGVDLEFPLGLDDAFEKLNVSNKQYTEDEHLNQLIEGKVSIISFIKSQGLVSGGRKVILPGSFNPLHEGHIKLLEVACSMCEGSIPCFEISAINADKPPLSLPEIKKRVKQFQDRGKTVILTNQPYFYKKAELLPDSTFVIGVDTAVRLINTKYYDGSHEKMLEVLLGIQNLGCDFLVAGRKVGETFQVLSDLSVPEPVQKLFRGIDANTFRVDISSSELRAASAL
ncbi:hypothetical protein R1sor_008791 [Riccia sorocarpa]|uniref:Cytidyltransferase-like domain-containing protein n=1 Tax=Riccia sorocarpa TaxID=122646 RepID=A0ABD3HY08_9MARC